MSRYTDRERYFFELAKTSQEYYIDYLSPYVKIAPGTRVLEIGCGEGGNLVPFVKAGCTVAGVDIAPNKIDNARKFFADRQLDGDLRCADFLTQSPFGQDDRFDIVLIHDVIEHIEPPVKGLFFDRLRSLIAPGGCAFFGFPAWYMPFGGHQQICSSRMCALPFVHLLPGSLYPRYLKLFGEESLRIDELMSIRRSKMTVGIFEKLAAEHGFAVADRTLWLVSPHYKVKFNLTPRRLWKPLYALRCMRNFLSTSCFYILVPLNNGKQ